MNALARGSSPILALGCLLAACSSAPGVVTHGSAERLGASQVATLRAQPVQGVPRTSLMLVTERATGAAWPLLPERGRAFTEARLAPGAHEVRVLCTDLQAHRLFHVDVNAYAGHFYTLRCEIAEVGGGMLGMRVVVTDDGTTRRQP